LAEREPGRHRHRFDAQFGQQLGVMRFGDEILGDGQQNPPGRFPQHGALVDEQAAIAQRQEGGRQPAELRFELRRHIGGGCDQQDAAHAFASRFSRSCIWSYARLRNSDGRIALSST
jgi:hypothetical protein